MHQAVLRGAQILERLGQFASAGFHVFIQPRVLDCHYRLVSKGLQQLDAGLCVLIIDRREVGDVGAFDHLTDEQLVEEAAKRARMLGIPTKLDS